MNFHFDLVNLHLFVQTMFLRKTGRFARKYRAKWQIQELTNYVFFENAVNDGELTLALVHSG